MNATLYCPFPRHDGQTTAGKLNSEPSRQSRPARQPEPKHHEAPHEHSGPFPSRLMLGVTATLLVVFLGIVSAIMLDDAVKGTSFSTEPAAVATDGALPVAEAMANWVDSDPVAQNATRAVLVTYAR